MRRKMLFLPLVFLIISAVDSNRNLPSAALFGSSLIFYFLFAAIFFLFPTALVSAELASSHPEKEGVFYWVRHAFGEKWGMVAIWLQWINTIVWFPTILSFIAGALAFVINPSLINSKVYMLSAILIIFWALTLINLKGIHVSAKVNSVLVVIGTLIPVLFLIFLGIFWFLKQETIHLSFSLSAIIPQVGKFDTWTALIAVMSSFLGMELSGVHIRHVQQPQTTFPRALFFASLIILGTMSLGALVIAEILPLEQINLAGGIMQVFAAFFHEFNLGGLIPIMTLFIVLGSVGGLINWMVSPAKGFLFAAQHGFLPSYFAKLNRQEVPSRILFAQGVLVSLVCALLLYVPSVNAFYWFLTALSTGLYMLMYLLVFFAAMRLKKMEPTRSGFTIPGGKVGLSITCLFGIIGAFLTYFFGFVPPENVDVGSSARYVAMIVIGNCVFIAPVLFALHYKHKRNKKKRAA